MRLSDQFTVGQGGSYVPVYVSPGEQSKIACVRGPGEVVVWSGNPESGVEDRLALLPVGQSFTASQRVWVSGNGPAAINVDPV